MAAAQTGEGGRRKRPRITCGNEPLMAVQRPYPRLTATITALHGGSTRPRRRRVLPSNTALRGHARPRSDCRLHWTLRVE